VKTVKNNGISDKIRPTKRAPDGWDSARFQAIFVALAGFRFRAFFSPAAGNANRWAVSHIFKSREHE
jgi:hypothetical protein